MNEPIQFSDVKLIVFDLAGTTVQDHGEVPDAFRAALKRHGMQVTPEEVVEVRGSSKREAIINLLPESPDRFEKGKRVYESFKEELVKRYADSGVREMDGVAGLFKMLQNRGIRISLNTGFDREITSLLLKMLKWDDSMIDAVVCGDDVSKGRPEPDLIFEAMKRVGVDDAQRVANVGDTVLDVKAGQNARVRWNIGVCSGAHGRSQLMLAAPTHVINSVAELGELFV